MIFGVDKLVLWCKCSIDFDVKVNKTFAPYFGWCQLLTIDSVQSFHDWIHVVKFRAAVVSRTEAHSNTISFIEHIFCAVV